MTTARSSARADADRARQHQQDHTKLANACTELAALWPQLAHALAADTAATDVIGRGSLPDRTPRLVNRDVAEAHIEIIRWTSSAWAECGRILRLGPHRPYGVLAMLHVIPDWHDHLYRLNLPTAGYLYADALHAHHTARRALGLRTHDRPIGANCPEHPDHPAPLYWLGKEGALDDAILASALTKTIWRIPTGAIIWTHSDTVRCPHCGTIWAGRAAIAALAARLAHTPTIHLLDAEALTAALAADGIHIQPGTLRVWAHRGYLTSHGTDHRGRALYDVDEAEKCATVTANRVASHAQKAPRPPSPQG